jgi:hypothetical protein
VPVTAGAGRCKPVNLQYVSSVVDASFPSSWGVRLKAVDGGRTFECCVAVDGTKTVVQRGGALSPGRYEVSCHGRTGSARHAARRELESLEQMGFAPVSGAVPLAAGWARSDMEESDVLAGLIATANDCVARKLLDVAFSLDGCRGGREGDGLYLARGCGVDAAFPWASLANVTPALHRFAFGGGPSSGAPHVVVSVDTHVAPLLSAVCPVFLHVGWWGDGESEVAARLLAAVVGDLPEDEPRASLVDVVAAARKVASR